MMDREGEASICGTLERSFDLFLSVAGIHWWVLSRGVMRFDFVIKIPLASVCRVEHTRQERKQRTQARHDGGPNQDGYVEMTMRNGKDHDRLVDRTNRTK